jgi:putative peptide maturation system protein
VLRLAKLNGQLQFVQRAADAALIRQGAEHLDIKVSDDELQQAADEFRMARGLHEVDALETWLMARQLSFDDWEATLEDEVIERKLRTAVTENQIELSFAQHKLSFDAATISHIVVKDMETAKELRAQIIEESADFHKLARQHSLNEATRPAGGYVGKVRRAELEAAAEAAIFGAKPGMVVGPFKTEQGWRLIRVHALSPATLDEATRAEIKARLFDEWLSARRRKARVSIPLLQAQEK